MTKTTSPIVSHASPSLFILFYQNFEQLVRIIKVSMTVDRLNRGKKETLKCLNKIEDEIIDG
jgi:hypothetical protein